MNSARAILIGLLFFVPTITLAAPLYQPGETLNPSCLPSDADCTVATTTSSTSFATTTNDYWLTQQYSLANLASVGSTTGTTTFLGDAIFSRNVSTSDGTAAAPSYIFSSAPTTGMFLSGSGVGLSYSGVARLYANGSGAQVAGALTPTTDDTRALGTASFRWNALSVGTGVSSFAGNLGLGTTSPYTKLSVVGDIVATAITATSTFNTSGTTGGYKIDGNLILQASSTNSSTLLGRSAGAALLSDGLYNTALGFEALKVATSSDSNTAVGYRALYSNTTGAQNTANGAYSLYANTTGTTNTANGYGSLYSNTTGSNNSASGYASLYFNTTGSQNTASGLDSLFSNTTGSNNTANGYYSLFYNTTGNQNSALGRGSLQANTTGSNNTATGYTSLYSNITGAQNTASGMYSLYYGTSTTYSTAIGYLSGVGSALAANDYNSAVDTYMTFIGSSASRDSNVASTTALINSTAIGYNAKVGGSNMLVLGNAANVGIGTSTPSSKLTITAPTPAITAHQMLTLYSNDAMAANTGGTIGFGGNYTTGGALAGWASIAGLKENGTTGDLAGYLQFGTRSAAGTNAEVMRISSTGNVGIGTTTPDKKFQVYDATTGASLSVRNAIGNGNGSTLLLGASRGTAATPTNVADGDSVGVFDTEAYSGGTWFSSAMMKSQVDGTFTSGQRPPSALTFFTNNANASRSEKMRITAGGNVGIGTTSPQATFEIGNSTNTVQRALFTNTNSGTAAYSEVGIRNGYGTSDDSLRLITFGTGWTTSGRFIQDSALLEAAGNINGGLSISTAAAAPIRFYTTGNSERMRVDSGGNVGIGTTTPFAKLSVHANSGETNTTVFQIASSTASATSSLFSVDNSGNVFQGGGALQFGGSSPVLSALIYNGASTGSMSIRSGSASAVILNALNSSTAGRTAVSIFNSAVQSQSSGSNVGLVINPSYNQSGTAANTDLLINRTETALGTGAQYLFDAQVGGTSRFNITNAGKVGIGTTTPTYKLDVNGGSTASQLHFTSDGADSGGYLVSAAANNFFMSAGAAFNGSSWIAKSTDASIIGGGGGGIPTGSLSFLTNTGLTSGASYTPTTRMVVTGTGDVGIGTTTPSSRLSVTQSANTSAGGLWIAETGNTDFRSIYMATDGTMSFYGGDTSGALNTATLNSSGAWTNASDKSYKENIVDLGTKYGLAAVLASTPRFYEMKGNHVPQVGFIAQELEAIIPEVVDGKEGSKGISYGNLVAVAFQAIKELNTKVENMFKSLFVKELHIEEKLCVEEVCINKEQLKKLLLKAGAEEVKETPKENNKPKEETPKPQENATTTATTTPEVVTPPVATSTPEVIKEEPKEEVKEETASTTPETVVEEPEKEEEKPKVEEPPKEEVKEEIKPVEEPKKEEPKVEEEKKEEPKSEETPQS